MDTEKIRAGVRWIAVYMLAGALMVGCVTCGSERNEADSEQVQATQAPVEFSSTLEALRAGSRALEHADDLGDLVERAREARLVLLGEASHGTSEFYTWRKELSRRLVEEQGFSFIVVEGDWASALE